MANDLVRVLLVEDEPADAMLVEEALIDPAVGRWAELLYVRALDDLGHGLATGPVDCVLLDLGLPGCSGLEALHFVLDRCRGVPIVVLTGHDAEESALDALAAGAQDYVTKGDVTPRGLRRAIRYTMERHRMRVQLAEANARLTDANARLQEFVRFVAHDLKNPLSAIGGFAELLRSASVAWSETEAQMIAAICSVTAGAVTMVDDLLAYSQVAGQLPTQPLELDKHVEQAVSALRPLLDRAEAMVEVPAPLPVIAGHPVALHHVLRNLFANAATYRHPDRLPVITVTAEAAGDNRWRISITDNGIGVPPDQREAIFGPGTRLAPEHAPGSGLGLAAARTLVERHGGRISVGDNPAGSGAQFLIELPGVPRAEPRS